MNFITTALATYRLTKLVIDDEITQPLREKTYPLQEKSPKFAYLMSCPWCISIYAGVITVVLDKKAPAVNAVLASSAVTGLIYTNLG